ncbi:glycosyltransferase WbsX family protein [Aridibaculum aurantiacum]|uniref:glycosyltransferase WbsX family protein n=1 Tax=Aridibaculum aurantiacum TaxID=2810307 RepID=UPI001A96E42C|nr:glycoside hydrolase family 99-like domain-containing protein [Aridibaculum aurantiacum]
MSGNNIRTLAFYLPQYHPIPENDKWWGKGFTEWTNVAKAKPLFKNHVQPRVPADLGFYDLRLAESRAAQAELAKENGVDGFVYYHYWFGNGKRLLERPLDEILDLGEPDFPFCLCWANQTWSGIWFGAADQILMKQEYPGKEDTAAHFEYLIKAFRDPRYITVDGKPLFMVYDVTGLPDPKQFSKEIKAAAIAAGLPGVYLMASNLTDDNWDVAANGFDGKVSHAFNKSLVYLKYYNSFIKKVKARLLKYFKKDLHTGLKVVDHRELVEHMDYVQSTGDTYPVVVPNWDNTPRSGKRGVVLTHSSPELLATQVEKSIDFLEKTKQKENLIFIKSWNEWAEGNYLEPDILTGHKYLEVFKRIKNRKQTKPAKPSTAEIDA